jgi:dTMP kinase
LAGTLVAIEGPKYVGKTTLVTHLQARGFETRHWLFTKEPTASFDLGNEEKHVGVDLATLIVDDRSSHVRDVIQPALDEGLVVVTDRYVLSSFVFHCLDGVCVETVVELNAQFPRPDVLLVLQCSPGSLGRRRGGRGVHTRLLSAISPEAETLGYLTYADLCRPVSGEIGLGYNETMKDCDVIARRLIAAVQAKRSDHD